MRSPTILIIDDDDGVREIIRFSLEAAAGWQTLVASSGNEGIKRAIAAQPNAILLDVMMPNMDGAETYRQLQSHAATRLIPVIFLTAKAKSSEQRQLMNMGVTGLIVKPFEAQSLVQQIRQILTWNE